MIRMLEAQLPVAFSWRRNSLNIEAVVPQESWLPGREGHLVMRGIKSSVLTEERNRYHGDVSIKRGESLTKDTNYNRSVNDYFLLLNYSCTHHHAITMSDYDDVYR